MREYFDDLMAKNFSSKIFTKCLCVCVLTSEVTTTIIILSVISHVSKTVVSIYSRSRNIYSNAKTKIIVTLFTFKINCSQTENK